jgi:hypothetical protein
MAVMRTYYVIYIIDNYPEVFEWKTSLFELPFEIRSVKQLETLQQNIAEKETVSREHIKIINWSELEND